MYKKNSAVSTSSRAFNLPSLWLDFIGMALLVVIQIVSFNLFQTKPQFILNCGNMWLGPCDQGKPRLHRDSHAGRLTRRSPLGFSGVRPSAAQILLPRWVWALTCCACNSFASSSLSWSISISRAKSQLSRWFCREKWTHASVNAKINWAFFTTIMELIPYSRKSKRTVKSIKLSNVSKRRMHFTIVSLKCYS